MAPTGTASITRSASDTHAVMLSDTSSPMPSSLACTRASSLASKQEIVPASFLCFAAIATEAPIRPIPIIAIFE